MATFCLISLAANSEASLARSASSIREREAWAEISLAARLEMVDPSRFKPAPIPAKLVFTSS